MLDWITGTRAAQAPGAAGADKNALLEPPETPAPLFAVRAFKHAIFGTPQPVEPSDRRPGGTVRRVVERKSQEQGKAGEVPSKIEGFAGQAVVESCPLPRTQASKQIDPPSPSRPSGILMTPRTATTRKKSVSFGAHVVDNEGKRLGLLARSGLPNDYPGKFPSPWTPKVDGNVDLCRSKLTETLYEARSIAVTTADQVPNQSQNRSIGLDSHHNTLHSVKAATKTAVPTMTQPRRRQVRAKDDADVTMDLSEPRSQSGRYWKQEYESYADKTKREMERIVKKQRLAKKYALMKDSEVMALAALLKQERQKIARLEAKIAELTERIARGDLEGLDQEQLIKDLARKTTKALEHQEKVDNISLKLERQRSAMTDDHAMAGEDPDQVNSGQAISKGTGALASVVNEVLCNGDQAEAKIQLVQAENVALQTNLSRVKEELERFTKRREQHDERQKQRERRLEDQKKDYQERLRQALAEQLRCSTENAALKQQVAALQETARASTDGLACEDEMQQQHREILKELREAKEEAAILRIDKDNLSKLLPEFHSKAGQVKHTSTSVANALTSSVLDIWTQEAEPTPKAKPRVSKTANSGSVVAKSPLQPRAVNTTYASPGLKLGQHAGTTPNGGSKKASTPGRKPLTPSSSVLPVASPDPQSPSPPAANHRRNGQHTFFSPGPSILHLPSSPPMSPLPQPPRDAETVTTDIETQIDLPIPPSSPPQAGYGTLAFPLSTAPAAAASNVGARRRATSVQKITIKAGSMPSGATGNDGARKVLPPDRAAAAKARLEQRKKAKAKEALGSMDVRVALVA